MTRYCPHLIYCMGIISVVLLQYYTIFGLNYNIKHLGFSLCSNCLSPVPDKVSAIIKMPLLQNKKQLRSFFETVSNILPIIANLICPVDVAKNTSVAISLSGHQNKLTAFSN